MGGLASEKIRWAESVEVFKQDEKTLAGDVLVTASYLSYVGCFSRSYRNNLLHNKWMNFFKSLEVSPEFVFRRISRVEPQTHGDHRKRPYKEVSLLQW